MIKYTSLDHRPSCRFITVRRTTRPNIAIQSLTQRELQIIVSKSDTKRATDIASRFDTERVTDMASKSDTEHLFLGREFLFKHIVFP